MESKHWITGFELPAAPIIDTNARHQWSFPASSPTSFSEIFWPKTLRKNASPAHLWDRFLWHGQDPFSGPRTCKSACNSWRAQHSQLDTAARYPPFYLRDSLARPNLSSSFILDAKIYTNTQTDSSGSLGRESMEKSIEASLQRVRQSLVCSHFRIILSFFSFPAFFVLF